MAAWTDLQILRANATTTSVLKELATCFTGSLRDWFDTLGEYRQLQFVQLPNVSTALSVIHQQFIGESAVVFEAARRDYLNMKCCSLNSKKILISITNGCQSCFISSMGSMTRLSNMYFWYHYMKNYNQIYRGSS